MTIYLSRRGWLKASGVLPEHRNQMFDDNVEVVTDAPENARQRAWAALKKVVHRADGTAAMPKGWPEDYDDPKRAGAGALMKVGGSCRIRSDS